jgi:succinate dehydrogenase / fumarate reductase flavoprotein subunit
MTTSSPESVVSAGQDGRHPMTGNALDGQADGGMERHTYDVVVIGAGGAGLRAAIAAHESGAKTAIVCKSLLGKAHTVMAEGGIAASSTPTTTGKCTSATPCAAARC